MDKGAKILYVLSVLNSNSDDGDKHSSLAALGPGLAGILDEIVTHHELSAWVLAQLSMIDPQQSLYDRTLLIHNEKARRIQSLQNFRVLQQLKESLKNDELPVVELKGSDLSMAVSQDPVYRVSKDIDLLVEPSNFLKVLVSLKTLGAVFDERILQLGQKRLAAFQYFEKDYPIYYKGLWIELHTRPLLGVTFAKGYDQLDLSRYGYKSNIDLAHYLLLHGVACSWFRAKWLFDAWTVLSQLSAQDWDRLLNSLLDAKTITAVESGIASVETVFGPLGQDKYRSTEKVLRRANRDLKKLYSKRIPRARHKDGIFVSGQLHTRLQSFRFRYLNISELILKGHGPVIVTVMSPFYLCSKAVSRLQKLRSNNVNRGI